MASLFRPARLGRRCMRSGLPPAMAEAVKWVMAAQQPAVTMPHSAPVNSARRWLTPSISSSMLTKLRDAWSMARLTSGRVGEPVMMVNVPRALMTGRTPMERYISAPSSKGAATACRTLPPKACAAASNPPCRNRSRRLYPAHGSLSFAQNACGIGFSFTRQSLTHVRGSDQSRDREGALVSLEVELRGDFNIPLTRGTSDLPEERRGDGL